MSQKNEEIPSSLCLLNKRGADNFFTEDNSPQSLNIFNIFVEMSHGAQVVTDQIDGFLRGRR